MTSSLAILQMSFYPTLSIKKPKSSKSIKSNPSQAKVIMTPDPSQMQIPYTPKVPRSASKLRENTPSHLRKGKMLLEANQRPWTSIHASSAIVIPIAAESSTTTDDATTKTELIHGLTLQEYNEKMNLLSLHSKHHQLTRQILTLSKTSEAVLYFVL
jgi:hypothetical protein